MNTTIPIRARAFVNEYIKTMIISEAAEASDISAGYAYTLMKNPAVCLAIADALEQASILACIDASWVLVRLARLADFSIKNFIEIEDDGRPYYDFTNADEDDWYCINEITVGSVRGSVRKGTRLYVDEVKIKTTDKLKALELVGKHIDVQAFKDRAELNGTITVTEVTRKIVNAMNHPPDREVINGTAERIEHDARPGNTHSGGLPSPATPFKV